MHAGDWLAGERSGPDVSCQCVLAGVKANSIPGVIRRSVNQGIKGSDCSPLTGTQWTASGIQCPALDSFSCTTLEEEMCWLAAACPAEAAEMVWAGAPLLWGEAEGTGLLQPGEELALGTPNTSLLVLTRRLSKRWSQALYWSKKMGEWRTVVINGNRRGFELRRGEIL